MTKQLFVNLLPFPALPIKVYLVIHLQLVWQGRIGPQAVCEFSWISLY